MEICWEKSIELDTGVSLTYWKMLEICVDVQSGKAIVKCAGWVSQAAKEDGKESGGDMNVAIDFTSFDPTGQIVAGLLQMVQAAQ